MIIFIICADSSEAGYFVPPPRGAAPSQGWSQRSQLAIDHIIGGSFETAARLLHQQVIITLLLFLLEHEVI